MSEAGCNTGWMPFLLPNHSFQTLKGWLVGWGLTALSAQIGYIMPQKSKIYHTGQVDNKNIMQLNNKGIQ